MKKPLLLTLLTLLLLIALPAGAACTTPPIITAGTTGIIGTQSASAPNAEYINAAQPHMSPTVERYTIDLFTNYGGPNRWSFGAGSGIDVRFGPECTTPLGGGACVTTLPPQRITSVDFATYASSPPITRVFVNGYKVIELYAAMIHPSGDTWTDGVARVVQGRREESNTFYLEGWNTVNGVTTWKSTKFWVYGDCGPF